ncbi:MAG: homocysteine S-methyltransferase family protein [Clostridia bacterium]|nr:homocysteine S-methyltransferase family protein [Clostridia bacterium]
MTRSEFQALLDKGPVILDGATGSNLRASGMPVGVCTEQWVLENPEILKNLQRAYVEAGSQIVYAPSFSANRLSLSMYGLEDKLAEMNRALVLISRDAVDGRAYVAGDMTTTGKPVDAEGGVSYDALIEIYREQAQALLNAGVDLIGLETMLGVTECSAAIEAIRSVCDLPVMCTLTLDAVGAAYFDGDAELAAQTLPALGADAIGVNCGQGPELYVSVIQRMRAHTDLPLIAKPNAGLPVIQSDGSAVYGMSPGKFAREMQQLKKAGASILGGCCGTTPEHIRMLKEFCG